MEKFHWNDTYSVGVSQMDDEHKKILSIINQMVEHPETSERSETISDILGQLTTYAYEHFDHEEKLLEEHGYPDLNSQRVEHRKFRRRIATFCSNIMSDRNRQYTAPEDLLEYLMAWWKDHILVSDKKYGVFFAARGIS